MDSSPPLHSRDKLLRDTFTPAETILYILILVTANVVFWLADPRSQGLMVFFIIAAALTPFVLKSHERHHPFFVVHLWRRFALYTVPVWCFLLQFTVGLWQQPIDSVSLDKTDYLYLNIPKLGWLPASTAAGHTWPTVLGFASIYLVVVSLYLVPKSRYFFERLIKLLCLSATFVALSGYFHSGLELPRPLLTKGTGATDFFGFFPYDGHWAAFATLWVPACVGMALIKTGYSNRPVFIHSTGPWYLAAAFLLGGSALWIEAHWPAAILMLTYAIVMSWFSVRFLAASRDPHRKAIAGTSAVIAAGMLAAGCFRCLNALENGEAQEPLRQAAWNLFFDRPLFGWGMDSFSHLLPFYGSDLLMGETYLRAGNDALQLLSEFGLVGILPPVLLAAYFLTRCFAGGLKLEFTNLLLIGLAAVILLAFVDTPFMSPAVFFSFLVLFFTALRWADLCRYQADEVDGPRPNLVTSENPNRFPFA